MKKEIFQKVFKYVTMFFIALFSVFLFYNMWPDTDAYTHTKVAEILLEDSDVGVLSWCSVYYSYPVWHLSYLFILECMSPIKNFITEQNIDFRALCAAITCALGIVGMYLTSIYVYTKILPEKYKRYVYVLAISLIFTGPYYVKNINDSYYLGQGIVLPWHSPTTIAVYPLAILCFGMYYILAQKEIDRQNRKGWIYFSCLLLISGLVKPSFYQMFIPGLAIFCLLELIFSKGKKILFCMYSFLAVLPTCVLALIQHSASIEIPQAEAGSASEIAIAGIGIEWLKVQKLYSDHPLQSLLLMWIFPLFTLVLYILSRKRDIRMSLSLSCAISGLLQYAFFYLQMRPQTGDFAWGYYISLAILFMGCISYFLEICKKNDRRFLRYSGMILYYGHVLFGFIYGLKLMLMSPEFIYLDPLF